MSICDPGYENCADYQAQLQELLAREAATIERYDAKLDAAESRAATLDARVQKLERQFQHYHAAKYDSAGLLTDECAKCGLDLRDSIHLSAQEDE